MKEGLVKISHWILECVFPHFCLACGQRDVYFCTDCRQAEWFSQPGQMIDQTMPGLDFFGALTKYQTGIASARLIEDFKYAFLAEAKKEIRQWLLHTAWLAEKFSNIDYIIPVPLHARRLAERGYNQAEIIADYLGAILKKPVNSLVLARTRATKQQAKLHRADRIQNVAGAFVCKTPRVIEGKKILLVDDVYTTGSTIRECAAVLRASKAASISGFTLARG